MNKIFLIICDYPDEHFIDTDPIENKSKVDFWWLIYVPIGWMVLTLGGKLR